MYRWGLNERKYSSFSVLSFFLWKLYSVYWIWRERVMEGSDQGQFSQGYSIICFPTISFSLLHESFYLFCSTKKQIDFYIFFHSIYFYLSMNFTPETFWKFFLHNKNPVFREMGERGLWGRPMTELLNLFFKLFSLLRPPEVYSEIPHQELPFVYLGLSVGLSSCEDSGSNSQPFYLPGGRLSVRN